MSASVTAMPGARLTMRGAPAAAIGGAILGIGWFLPIFHLAANRLVVGTPVYAATAFASRGWAIAALGLLGGLLLGREASRLASMLALALFCAALSLLATGLGATASDLVAGQPPAARARLAAGAWAGLLLLSGLAAAAAGATRIRGAGWLTLAASLGALVMLYRAGIFDNVSLAVEYRVRADAVHAAVLRHVALSAAAITLAAVASVALYALRPLRGAVEVAVNGLQVVPAVALLGALVAVASGLLAAYPRLRAAGLSTLGPGPAILAAAAYLLLPFWRGIDAALRAPDTATLDAAAAIGLSRRQILARVRLPLGAPILVGALRVAAVQGIGLATLGALVGAGGLGGIVFDGMAQFAPDLILLGAAPIVGLSLLVERFLSLVEDRARRRWRG